MLVLLVKYSTTLNLSHIVLKCSLAAGPGGREQRSCLHGGRKMLALGKILEGKATFRLVYTRKFWLGWLQSRKGKAKRNCRLLAVERLATAMFVFHVLMSWTFQACDNLNYYISQYTRCDWSMLRDVFHCTAPVDHSLDFN